MDGHAEMADGYYEEISFETLTEAEWADLPLRRKLLVELEDKLDVEIPAARRYGRGSYRGGTVYLTNDDLIAIAKGVLDKLGAEPRFPLIVLADGEDI